MAGGFGAVSEELQQAAGKIGDTVDQVSGCVWRGPSGDYGHPGVQSGWEQFIQDMRSQIEILREQAVEHGIGLKAAAQTYLETDVQSGEDFGRLDVPGGGFVNPEVARRLGPGGWKPMPPIQHGDDGPLF